MHEDILTWSPIKPIILEHAPRKSNVWLIAYRKFIMGLRLRTNVQAIYVSTCKSLSIYMQCISLCLHTMLFQVWHLFLCATHASRFGLVWVANARPRHHWPCSEPKSISKRHWMFCPSLFERRWGNLFHVWEPHFTSKGATWQPHDHRLDVHNEMLNVQLKEWRFTTLTNGGEGHIRKENENWLLL